MIQAFRKTFAAAALVLGLMCLPVLVACGGEPDAPITESAGPVYEVGVSGMT